MREKRLKINISVRRKDVILRQHMERNMNEEYNVETDAAERSADKVSRDVL